MLVKLGIVGLALGAVAVLLLRGVDIRGLAAQGFELIRSGGPWVFFGAMAVLPAVGFPMSFFYLAAGPAFGEQMTLPGVVAAGVATLVVNFSLSYWLSSRALRPAAEWLLSHTRFRVPQVKPENQLTMTVLVRVTPGPPLVLQSYILGLAGVRFSTYLAVSMAVQTVLGTGMMVFGKALMEGNGGLAVMGAMVLVAAVVLVQVLRKRFAKPDGGQA